MTDDNIDLSEPLSLYQAIGEAIQSYAAVETTQASILEAILKIDFQRSHAIFFAVQNVRSRNELIETLLELEFKDGLRKYWASCSKFLLTLAQFRNAIAHWHPYVNIYVSKTDPEITRTERALGHPVLSRNFKGLEQNDFPPFLKDCLAIRQDLSSLLSLLKERPSTLPDKFQQPIIHRNEAVLRPLQKPKAHQPLRPPSHPKLSAAQKRAKALKNARTKSKR